MQAVADEKQGKHSFRTESGQQGAAVSINNDDGLAKQTSRPREQNSADSGRGGGHPAAKKEEGVRSEEPSRARARDRGCSGRSTDRCERVLARAAATWKPSGQVWQRGKWPQYDKACERREDPPVQARPGRMRGRKKWSRKQPKPRLEGCRLSCGQGENHYRRAWWHAKNVAELARKEPRRRVHGGGANECVNTNPQT